MRTHNTIAHILLLAVLVVAPFFTNLAVVSAQANSENRAPVADDDYILLVPLPQTYKQSADCLDIASESSNCKTDFVTYLHGIYKLAVGVAGALAVILFSIGGFQYMTSAIPGVKSNGVSRMQNAILGLVLVLSAYVILNTINPQLLDFKFAPTPSPDAIDLNAIADLTDATRKIRQDREKLEADAKRLTVELANETDTEKRAAIQSQLDEVNDKIRQNESATQDQIRERLKIDAGGAVTALDQSEAIINAGTKPNMEQQCKMLRTFYETRTTLMARKSVVEKNAPDSAATISQYDEAIQTLSDVFKDKKYTLQSQGKWAERVSCF